MFRRVFRLCTSGLDGPLNGRSGENQRLFSVGDLGLKNLNTTFNHVALEEHVVASTLEDTDPCLDTFRFRSCRTLLSKGLCIGVTTFATHREGTTFEGHFGSTFDDLWKATCEG